MQKTLLLLFLLLPLGMAAQPKIQLVDFSAGFVFPVDIANCGDSRLFVVERKGVIWALDSTGARLDTFLNIVNQIVSTQNEQGLLGLTFDPNFAQNGYFYVDYIQKPDESTRVSRFKVSATNPNRADPGSEFPILNQAQPYWNHNGGCLKFGPDGYLYISFGDGGGANDGLGNGQNTKTLLAKILRIDVRNSSPGQPYAVPPDNPFVGNADYLPEIWSLGWRNPWRYSFDRLTGDMWVGDVGQNLWEEADFEPANTGGRNYGWRCYEGTHTFNTGGCGSASEYQMPFFDYAHSNANGCSVTGGYVYRGSLYPDLYGCYVFGDYCSGKWWFTRRNADGTFTTNLLASLNGYELSAFGQDYNGELYACQYASGKVVKIKELCSPFKLLASVPLAVCEGSMSGAIALTPLGATGAVTYQWSTGSTTSAISGLDPGIYTVEAKDGNGCIRRDTIAIPNAGPETPVIFTPDTIGCESTEIFLSFTPAAPGVEYQWFVNGVPTQPQPNGGFYLPSTGTFAFQVKAVNQFCETPLSDTTIVTATQYPFALLSFSGDTITAQVSPPNSIIQWYFFGSQIPGATNTFYVAQQSGNYQAIVTTPFGCSSQSTITVEVSGINLIPDYVRHFSLSPNPTEQNIVVTMEFEAEYFVSLALNDAQQREVYQKVLKGQKIAETINMVNLPAGTYFLNVKTEKGSFVRRVVKK